MKKISFIILFLSVFLYSNCDAQSFASRIANNITLNDDSVTFKTAPSSLHPYNIGYGIDSCLNLILYVQGLISSSGSLAAVTAIGHTTTIGMVEDDGTNKSTWNGSSLAISHGSTLLAQYGILFSKPGIGLKDVGSSNIGLIFSGDLTAYRAILIPDEGDGTGIQSSIVIHNTQHGLNVYDNIGDSSSILPTSFNSYSNNILSGYQNILTTSSIGISFQLTNGSSGGSISLLGTPTIGNIVNATFRDNVSGIVAYLSDITGGGVILPNTEIGYGNGTSITSNSKFTYDEPNNHFLISDGGSSFFDIDINANVFRMGDIDDVTNPIQLKIDRYIGYAKLGDADNINNGINFTVSETDNEITIGDVDNITNGTYWAIDCSAQVVSSTTNSVQDELHGYNQWYRAGDVNNSINGQKLWVDVHDNRSFFGDPDGIVNGLQIALYGDLNKGDIGDVNGISNGLSLEIDVQNNIASIGDVHGASNPLRADFDVANQRIISGDVDGALNGLKEKIDVNNNEISIGDVDNYSGGIRFEVNPGTQDVAIRDNAGGTTNGTGIDVDFLNNKIELGTPYGFGGLVGQSIDLTSGHIEIGDPLHSYNLAIGMYEDIDLSTSSIKEGDVANNYNGFGSKLDVVNATFEVRNIFSGFVTGSGIRVDWNANNVVIGDVTGGGIYESVNAGNSTWSAIGGYGTKIFMDDGNKVTYLTNSVAYPTMKNSVPSSGSSITLANNVRGYYINPSSTIATLTIKTPSTASYDGEEMIVIFGGTITSGSVVTSLSYSSGSIGNIISSSLSTINIPAGYCVHMKYSQSNNKWYIF